MPAMTVVLLAALLAGLLAAAWPNRGLPPPWGSLVAAMPSALGVLQVILERYRWQMLPAYILAAMLLLRGVTQRGRGRTGAGPARPLGLPMLRSVAAILGGSLFIPLSLLANSVFPVFEPPAPAGPHRAGTTWLHLVDPNRSERFAADPAARRELMIQVFYPADASRGARTAPYLYEPRRRPACWPPPPDCPLLCFSTSA